jgi:hypothetical protein
VREREEEDTMATTVSALRQHAGYEPALDLTGFEVQASDGRLGRIGGSGGGADARANGVEPVLLPVGAILSIDLTDRVVYLDRTRAEIRSVRPSGRRGVWYLLQESA